MTEKQLEQIKEQLPTGEHIDRMYRALEGDLRVITKDLHGRETRYTVQFEPPSGNSNPGKHSAFGRYCSLSESQGALFLLGGIT